MAKTIRPKRRTSASKRPLWQELAHLSCDPKRARANFERLFASSPDKARLKNSLSTKPVLLHSLAALFASAQSLSDSLILNTDYLDWLLSENLESAPTKDALGEEVSALVESFDTQEAKIRAIRRFKRRHQLRIALRDLGDLAPVKEITRELSNLADVCLEAVYCVCWQSLTQKFGTPIQQSDSQPASFAVLGMGKLGGQELNYSSDVDVIFIYSDDGHVTSPQSKPTALTNEEFFTRLAEAMTTAVGAITADGAIYRIDLRLRPEGATGPLVRSLKSCEYYYAALGETWERLALLKARHVAGNAELAADFLKMVEPFVFRRYGGEAVLRDMSAIKARIEREIVKADQLTRHVKLGIGGIREIEFILQALQVLHGGRQRDLRIANTLQGLRVVGERGLLPADDVQALANAYHFLRVVEHRLQMEADVQTHTVPDETAAHKRLARQMGFRTVAAFEQTLSAHTSRVRSVYQNLLAETVDKKESTGATIQFYLPSPSADGEATYDEAFLNAMAHAGFADAKRAVKSFSALAYGPGFGHISAQTSEKFVKLLPKILKLAGDLADPDLALQKFEQFVERYGSRGSLYDAFNANPRLVELLLKLFDNSRFLADTFLRWPDLFDDVMRGAALGQSKNITVMLAELRQALPLSVPSWETAMSAARSFKRSELARIALADVMGLTVFEWTLAELSFLAEALLRFGVESCIAHLKLDAAPLAVIGLGKFGGQEITYGADLDVLFITDDDTDSPTATRFANALIEFVSKQTSDGALYKLDARLRPDGDQGPLVPSLTACRHYYDARAWTWERQSLTKARFVAGNERIGQSFIKLAHETIYARPLAAAAFDEICAMRRRIDKERSVRARPELSYKTVAGGLMDVEFAVQTLQLRHGWQHESLRCTPTLAALGRLTARGLVDEPDHYVLRYDYLFLRRLDAVLRRYENSPVSAIPANPAEQAKLSKHLGFKTPKDFWQAYDAVRRRIHAVYEKLMEANQ